MELYCVSLIIVNVGAQRISTCSTLNMRFDSFRRTLVNHSTMWASCPAVFIENFGSGNFTGFDFPTIDQIGTTDSLQSTNLSHHNRQINQPAVLFSPTNKPTKVTKRPKQNNLRNCGW